MIDFTFDEQYEADFPAALITLSWRDRANMWHFIGGYSLQRWL